MACFKDLSMTYLTLLAMFEDLLLLKKSDSYYVCNPLTEEIVMLSEPPGRIGGHLVRAGLTTTTTLFQASIGRLYWISLLGLNVPIELDPFKSAYDTTARLSASLPHVDFSGGHLRLGFVPLAPTTYGFHTCLGLILNIFLKVWDLKYISSAARPSLHSVHRLQIEPAADIDHHETCTYVSSLLCVRRGRLHCHYFRVLYLSIIVFNTVFLFLLFQL
ncbi:hypothetical protein PanWU01x14_087920 [Parasponia andersonii]|uniref:Uncharacterized protein n=1 Tax=Parasponia andersonii TaxID=3476 RepID=A0A2P5D7U5_PARAD|nr:hypothetical protein PanWU01x14_087920 [Parasponia andersonii]